MPPRSPPRSKRSLVPLVVLVTRLMGASAATPTASQRLPPLDPKTSPLFSAVALNDNLALRHRLVMAPLTRMRADDDRTPNRDMAEYYSQRTTPGGLLITEGIAVSTEAHGYPRTTGLYSDAQQEGWARVVEAVHAKGGLVVAQLWHCGRASHPSLQPQLDAPPAPSAIAASGRALCSNFTWGARPTPREMSIDDVRETIEDYARAARRARAAGFDAVELHAANGYLPDQFTCSSSNARTDEYGGGVANRCRFTLEVLGALVEAVGAGRVGVRLSPAGKFNDMADADPRATYSYLIGEADQMGLAYLHITEPDTAHALDDAVHPRVLQPSNKPETAQCADELTVGYWARDVVKSTPIIAAGGFTEKLERACGYISEGTAAAVALGRGFIANPDLPFRLRHGLELNEAVPDTFYGGGSEGYLDYPFHPDNPLGEELLA